MVAYTNRFYKSLIRIWTLLGPCRWFITGKWFVKNWIRWRGTQRGWPIYFSIHLFNIILNGKYYWQFSPIINFPMRNLYLMHGPGDLKSKMTTSYGISIENEWHGFLLKEFLNCYFIHWGQRFLKFYILWALKNVGADLVQALSCNRPHFLSKNDKVRTMIFKAP